MRRVRIDSPATFKDESLVKPIRAPRAGICVVLVGTVALLFTALVVGVVVSAVVFPAGIVWRQKRPDWSSIPDD